MPSKEKSPEKGLLWPNLSEVAALESVKSRLNYSLQLSMFYFSRELASAILKAEGKFTGKKKKKILPVKMAFKTVI